MGSKISQTLQKNNRKQPVAISRKNLLLFLTALTNLLAIIAVFLSNILLSINFKLITQSQLQQFNSSLAVMLVFCILAAWMLRKGVSMQIWLMIAFTVPIIKIMPEYCCAICACQMGILFKFYWLIQQFEGSTALQCVIIANLATKFPNQLTNSIPLAVSPQIILLIVICLIYFLLATVIKVKYRQFNNKMTVSKNQSPLSWVTFLYWFECSAMLGVSTVFHRQSSIIAIFFYMLLILTTFCIKKYFRENNSLFIKCFIMIYGIFAAVTQITTLATYICAIMAMCTLDHHKQQKAPLQMLILGEGVRMIIFTHFPVGNYSIPLAAAFLLAYGIRTLCYLPISNRFEGLLTPFKNHYVQPQSAFRMIREI